MPEQIVIDRVKEEKKEEIPRPPQWNIILINDDFTPIEFVFTVLVAEFKLSDHMATQVLFKAHSEGRSIVCQVASADVADTKCARVITFARSQGFPLTLTPEKA